MGEAMPTAGPVMVSDVISCHMGYIVSDGGGHAIANVYLHDLWASNDPRTRTADGQPTAVANRDLIVAAFNAATAAHGLGFDPIGAVQALPKLLEALVAARNTAAVRADLTERTYGTRPKESWVEDADAALAAARERSPQ